MTTRIAINGMGRIGRAVFRALHEGKWKGLELVAVNGPAPIETHLHLLRYDSVHGRFPGALDAKSDMLVSKLGKFPVFTERNPNNLPWKKLKVDVVLECTGAFTKRADSCRHIEAGAKKVLISAPSPDADSTIVYGVNNAAVKAKDQVISVGSCTTNCLAPVAKVLHEKIGIEHGYMTTIHAYTGDQNLVDGTHRDLRRARAATLSLIPSTTGAAKALGLVLPELKGKLDGTSIRVPAANVSMVDLTFQAKRATSVEEINALLVKAAKGAMKGVLEVEDKPLVSIDFNHTTASSIADLTGTQVVGGKFCRIAAWYDNEWGFSCRMLDVASLIG